MKLKLTTTIVALASCALAQAEPDQEKRQKPRGPRQVPEEILKRFDADGDGKLNEKERAAAMEARKAEMQARKAEMLKRFDADGDGELSKEERKAAMEARKAEILERYDTDGDGKLNEKEREAARKDMPRRGRPGGPEGGPQRKRRGPKVEKPRENSESK
ncbi:MAG: EF-hand domain-containing protein [Akkermansiaceae bacterium]